MESARAIAWLIDMVRIVVVRGFPGSSALCYWKHELLGWFYTCCVISVTPAYN